MKGIEFYPQSASTIAGDIDNLFLVWLALSVVVLIAVVAVLVYFAIKYRAGSNADRSQPDEATREHYTHQIEKIWMGLPLVIFLAMYVWSSLVFFDYATIPRDSMPIYVVGKQWMWHIQHPGGQREINELHVPVNQPVQLLMTSQDVIHSFSLPVFRVKQDVLPGRYTTMWFEATQTGEYHLFCTQYCGTSHSRMVGRVIVMQPTDYAQWLVSNNQDISMAARGAASFRAFGCSGCHGDHASVRAPRLEGVFGRPVALANGASIVADERYIRDSILLPDREVVAGYDPIMPTFRGQIDEAQLLDLIEYIKSIANLSSGGNS